MIKKESLSAKVEKEVEVKPLDTKVEKKRIRRKSYSMDLRIQSPASLGYLGIEGIDTAPALVRLAKVKGLDVIAVTDFYSGDYIDRITEAATESPVTVLPGMVIRAALSACDDIILMCLFPEYTSSAEVAEILEELEVPRAASGDESFIVPLEFDRVIQIIEKHQGIIIPSRMDKTPYRTNILPVLVEEYGFRAFDLAYYPESNKIFKKLWPKIKFQLLSFSNANALAQVGSRVSKVKLPQPGFPGLRTLIERTI